MYKKIIYVQSCNIETNMSIRRASHAGSWYSSSADELNSQLECWLSNVDVKVPSARALIAPHAGYAYCGECAAFAYKQVDPANISRVFILGPSHHFSLPGCALTQTKSYETPLYDLEIDQEVNEELLSTGKFDHMQLNVDEDEHSIEMQLPYIAKVMQSRRGQFKIIPVLVGSTSIEREKMYGEIFSKYMKDEQNLFVISSDFCHWGKRFRYTYNDKSKGNIYQSIEHLDRQGMDLIEKLDTKGFYQYLDQYANTICGRKPIGIFLNAVECLQSEKSSFKFHHYAQSSKCRNTNDSSVSYAAGTFSHS